MLSCPKKRKNSNRLEVIIIIIGIVFPLVFVGVFAWRQHFTLYQTINHELFGAYGDFIGGFLGTILSVLSLILVLKTFTHQQIVTAENSKQLDTQRFNDLFFQLIDLYNQEVKFLSNSVSISVVSADEKKTVMEETIQYDSKEFFDCAKKEIQDKFSPKNSFERNRRAALNMYMLYYIEHKDKLAGYFRILYRIYDLIDSSSIAEDAKKDYLKIVRAQLSESELFFLRYNAMSYYGDNFVEYLNKYHVLKHLPYFEMLEFKDWWSGLDQVERMGMNIVADYFYKILRQLVDQKTGYYSNESAVSRKYTFIIRVTDAREAQVTIIINPHHDNHTYEFRAFDKFSALKIQQLLDCFMKEVFCYSNFGKYNLRYETFGDPPKQTNKKTVIYSGIRAIGDAPLKLEYKFNSTISQS